MDAKVERGEFAETTLRHYCRNPKCRMKLPKPASNPREGFCTRGCYRSFYLHRCLVCEEPIERATTGGNPRLICKRSKCRNALRMGLSFGHFYEQTGQGPSDGVMLQEVPVNSAPASDSKPLDRRWIQIAGPLLTPNQFHCATVGGSAMDAVLRIEAQNKAMLKAAEEAEIAANGEFSDADWREVISSDDVKCFVTTFTVAVTDTYNASPVPDAQMPDDLTIPEFLRRQP
jgi:hypothetical protein